MWNANANNSKPAAQLVQLPFAQPVNAQGGFYYMSMTLPMPDEGLTFGNWNQGSEQEEATI